MSPFSFRCISSYLSPILFASSLGFVRFPIAHHRVMTFASSALHSRFACRGFPTGGDDGIRTHDPLLAGQVLSQLSYTPIYLGEFPSWSLKIEQQAIFTRIPVHRSVLVVS